MSGNGSCPVECSNRVVKKLVRKQLMTRLKGRQPELVSAESHRICDQARGYLDRLRQESSIRFLGLYLSMPFEVDVGPLLSYGLGEGIPVAVPLMAPCPASSAPSSATSGGEMLFVEVLSEEDLATHFLPKGKFRIRELVDEEAEEAFELVRKVRASSMDACQPLSIESRPREAPTPTPAAAGGGPSLRRRVWDPPALAALLHNQRSGSPPSVHSSCGVMIVPGAGFDTLCNRIGKGAGYYDRFLNGVSAEWRTLCPLASTGTPLPNANQQSQSPSSSLPSVQSAPPLHCLGVAFEDQLIDLCPVALEERGSTQPAGEKPPTVAMIPMDPHDVPLDAVVTPSTVYMRLS